MKNPIVGPTLLRSVLIIMLLPLSWICPAVSQQETSATSSEGQHREGQASQRSGHTAPGAAADSGLNISLPVLGAGTVNFIPVWTNTHVIGNSILFQRSNVLTVAGSVTATSFSGDGSALSRVNAATLGGLGSSAFAQLAGLNVFTANQTINANLTLSGSINNSLTLQGNLTDASGQQGANFIGGFGGDSSGLYPGNSVTPGVVGATISGGGGAVTAGSAHHAGQQGRSSGILPPGNFVVAPQNIAADFGTISGGAGNNIVNSFATIGGGYQNLAGGYESTVGGGASNNAEGSNSFVGGGLSNTAVSFGDTVGGGSFNTANSSLSNSFPNCAQNGVCDATVAGGKENMATGAASTVGGGMLNQATGVYSTVPGGNSNAANGTGSFAAGNFATANNQGSFVWSDGLSSAVTDTAAGQFVASASGGFIFYTQGTGIGAVLPSGSGSWSAFSDRNVKDNFARIDDQSLLANLAALPISTWNYKTQATSIRHMGPTAQDFRSAFGLGEDERHIANIDSEGVALAAIQALYKLNQEKDTKIAELAQSLQQLKAEVEKLAASSK